MSRFAKMLTWVACINFVGVCLGLQLYVLSKPWEPSTKFGLALSLGLAVVAAIYSAHLLTKETK